MRSPRSWRTENWADFLPRTLGSSNAPVDLHAVARLRHIKRIGLRFIVPRGVLLPVEGGFEVYLRDTNARDLDISRSESTDALTVRQRFSLAHEIAHTLFYNFSGLIPVANESISNSRELEDVCNRTAGHILIPTELLQAQIGRDYEKIDAAFVQEVARRFRTSIAVAIERLNAVQPANPFERCILLVRKSDSNAEIRAVYFGTGLRRSLPFAAKYTRVTEWLPEFPLPAIHEKGDCDWSMNKLGRKITFNKTTLGLGDEFLLQAEVGAN